MALEQGVASALIPQCVRLWESEGYAAHGCTLTLLLNWAWESVVTTKSSFDSACKDKYSLTGGWQGLKVEKP